MNYFRNDNIIGHFIRFSPKYVAYFLLFMCTCHCSWLSEF